MYKKLRFYLRFFVAFGSKYFLLIILGIFLSGLATLFLPRLISVIPRIYSVKKIGILGKYSLTDLPSDVLSKVSIGLTRIDASGEAYPGLAESWQISGDGKVFTFKINTGFKWQNNDPLISSDIKYQFRDAVIEYPDPLTLVFKLKDPFSPLLSLVSKPVLKISNSKFLSSVRFYGAGDYKISGFKANGRLLDSLDLTPQNNPALPKQKIFFYSTTQQLRTAFKLGLLDEISEITDIGDLAKWPNTQINTHPLYNRFIAILFNTQDPVLSGQSGKYLRTALSYAVDKSRWPNRTIGPISPTSWAFNPDIKKYDLDLTKSADLLKKVEVKPQILKLSTVPSYISVAELIKKDWEKLGLKVEISVSPDIPSDFQILLVAQSISVDPDQYNIWHSTQGSTNLTRLNNPRIDKLLEDGRKTYDQASRKKIYFDFQKYLVEEVPVVFLFYPEAYTIYKI